MTYPSLVKKEWCKVPIHIDIAQEGFNKYGEPVAAVSLDLKCNYQETAKMIYSDKKEVINITGTAYFTGDIASTVPTISNGTVTIFGKKRIIAVGEKAYNPDGTVNYTKLELM